MCTVVLNNYNKFNKGDYSIQTTSRKDFFLQNYLPCLDKYLIQKPHYEIMTQINNISLDRIVLISCHSFFLFSSLYSLLEISEDNPLALGQKLRNQKISNLNYNYMSLQQVTRKFNEQII